MDILQFGIDVFNALKAAWTLFQFGQNYIF